MQRDGGPGGAGGAGNPTGGSFTGPSESINLIGDHAYAFSGVIAVTDTEASLIEATTGNYYFVGRVMFSYPEFNADNFRYRIYMNGIQIWGAEVGSGTDANLMDPVNIIVPAYTELRITADNAASSSAIKQLAILTGRIYRG